jgi:hypothetical protein
MVHREEQMGYLVAFSWIVTLLAACVAAFELVTIQFFGLGAPQYIHGAEVATAMVIVLYVITRAIEAVAAGLRNRS